MCNMKRMFVGLVLGASVVMAGDVAKDDLLKVATAGKTSGTQLEMNKEEMQKADGGVSFTSVSYGRYFYSYWSNRLRK